MLRIAVLTLLIFAAAPVCAYESGDFQIWNTDSEEVKIHKGVKAVMEQEFRYGNDVKEFFYQHYDFGIVYGFDKMLDIGIFYRQIYEWIRKKWREEDMPNVNFTLKLDLWKFQLEDRNRIEYRHFPFAPDQVRYRNKFLLRYPFEFRKMTIAPFTSDEIFVSSNGSGFNQNRFESGLEFGLTKYAKVSASYMQQQIRGSISGHKWYLANVLWFKARIMF
jgi:hypothetical protein